jgi:hypothetical protein
MDEPQSAARSPGVLSTCRLHRQFGQWLRCSVPGASTETSSPQFRQRNDVARVLRVLRAKGKTSEKRCEYGLNPRSDREVVALPTEVFRKGADDQPAGAAP